MNPFTPAETHALLAIIFLNRYAVMLYAMIVPILVCSWIAQPLRGRAGRGFCAGAVLIGLFLLLPTGHGFLHGVFNATIIFWFFLGLSLVCHGADLFFKYQPVAAPAPSKPTLPTKLPDSDVYGKAAVATDEEIHQALNDRKQTAHPIGSGGYRYED
jgi:hypothetical protein